MTHLKFSFVGCLLLSLAAGAASAQSAASPFSPADGLGDHIASRVLNMNGYNITNLKDPFFEGDAVTLGYFNRHNEWDHRATRDVDFGGNSLGNIGEMVLDGTLMRGGAFEAPALENPLITGGTLSGISMRNAAISVPHVTGGTFEGPVMLAPTLDQATMTNSTLDSVKITVAEIDGLTVTGDIALKGGRLTGLGAPTTDSDAMTRAATREMIQSNVGRLQEQIDDLAAAAAMVAVNPGAAVAPIVEIEAEEEVALLRPWPKADDVVGGRLGKGLLALAAREGVWDGGIDVQVLASSIGTLPDGLNVDGSMHVFGNIYGGEAQFRPAPFGEDALGVLGGADVLEAFASIDAVVYRLPDGNLAAGIDTDTLPESLGFMKRSYVGANGNDGLDYAQLIGPMIATINQLNARVEALEAELRTRR